MLRGVEMKKYSRLSAHKFKKGKFITPINSLEKMKELQDEKAWTYGRMPEYLWIGLILDFFGRQEGLEILGGAISLLHRLAPELNTVRMSQILKLDSEIQKRFYVHLKFVGAKEALAPLTIYLTGSRASVFAEYFYCPEQDFEVRCEMLTETMRDLMDHQSYKSTDIRFVALYFNILAGKMHISKSQAKLLDAYVKSEHTDAIMTNVRPTVRALEMMILTFEKVDSEYLQEFWRCVSEMTDCNLFAVKFAREERNITEYMEKLHKVISYFAELFTVTNPLDDKMNVLFGIATYSFKRLKEIYEHNLFNSIVGRSCVRVLIEDYIMIKYLVKNESVHTNIWREYQLYGIGQYKLVLSRHRETGGANESHFDMQYIDALVNEIKNEEFIDMDTKYFDKLSIREKAESVDEKNLYGLYYDYDSAFEHGLWGAIRETSMLACNNPAHKYHCVPDVDDEVVVSSVLSDCVMVMNKIIAFLDEIYGVPHQLLNEVLNFEIKPLVE